MQQPDPKRTINSLDDFDTRNAPPPEQESKVRKAARAYYYRSPSDEFGPMPFAELQEAANRGAMRRAYEIRERFTRKTDLGEKETVYTPWVRADSNEHLKFPREPGAFQSAADDIVTKVAPPLFAAIRETLKWAAIIFVLLIVVFLILARFSK